MNRQDAVGGVAGGLLGFIGMALEKENLTALGILCICLLTCVLLRYKLALGAPAAVHSKGKGG
jgi:hypothetical protein